VYARGAVTRRALSSPVVAVLPAASALVIVGAGVALTARALGQM
jgi:hypothetical protein